MPDPRPPIAEHIRALKERSGLTWAQLARELEVGERQLLGWARVDGDRTPTYPFVVKIADYFSQKLGETVEPGSFYLPPQP
jgi:transcriptional regulator with XRE-family HTH domain